MDIAIVGAGPTGIINAISLCNAPYASQIRLHIFDPGKPCCGRSMNTDTQAMRLNTSLAVTFIDPDNTRDLFEFVQAQSPFTKPEDVAPREMVAKYLRARFRQARKRLKSGNIVKQTVEELWTGKDGRLVVVTAQAQRSYDAVIIATGLPFKALSAQVGAQPVISPYPGRSLIGLNRDAPVLVLGSRLSAVDVLVQLAKQKHKGPITLYSRCGYFPSVRRLLLKTEGQPFLATYRHAASRQPEGYSRVDCLVELFVQHLQRGGRALSDMIIANGRDGATQLHHDVQMCRNDQNSWQAIAMDVIDAMNELLPTLDVGERSRFMTHVHPWLGRFTFAMPLCNAEIVDGLFASGQLRILSRDEVLTQDRSAGSVIVNATGLEPAERDPLLAHLGKSGLIRFNGLGGLAADSVSCRLNEQWPLYGNGAILQGEVYTSSSIYSSSYGAQKITGDIGRLLA
ncbi:putative NAD(P)/FAD-binding protein YdhS [Pseudomonas sp. Y3 TE3536]